MYFKILTIALLFLSTPLKINGFNELTNTIFLCQLNNYINNHQNINHLETCNHFKENLNVECANEFADLSLFEKKCDQMFLNKIIDKKWQTQVNIFFDFMITYEKIFDNIIHLKKRISIFIDNLDFIDDFNLNNSTSYNLGINKFADMSHSEYVDYVSLGKNSYSAKNSCKIMEKATGTYPLSIDWRIKNAVTPVKDQGQCGSCWSFSTTGAVEGIYAINHGTILSFSEQQLVDCSYSYGNHGCNGGLMDNAMTYIIDNGITTESAYTYTATSTKNSCKKFTPETFLSACYDVIPNELQLTYAVAGQPVSIAIEADSRSFQLYKSGVYNDPSCGTNLDHGVLVVGYGTSKEGGDYWIVKNSWSNSWGDNGYILIARNSVSTSTSGICGIAMSPSYPEI